MFVSHFFVRLKMELSGSIFTLAFHEQMKIKIDEKK